MNSQSWNQSRGLNLMLWDQETAKVWNKEIFYHNFDIATPVTEKELAERDGDCS